MQVGDDQVKARVGARIDGDPISKIEERRGSSAGGRCCAPMLGERGRF